MTNALESASSESLQKETAGPSNWLRLGLVAAATALAGGLAAAWWYRSTLTKLREAEKDAVNPHFGIPEDNQEDES
jgi:hypothetical protein